MTRSVERILVVDDEWSISNTLKVVLRSHGYHVETAATAAEATAFLDNRQFSLVFTDLRLPDANGIDLLSRIKTNEPDTEVIVMSGYGSLDVTIEAIKQGAFYYVAKPFTPEQVLTLAERALERVAIKRENKTLKNSMAEAGELGMVGRSRLMLKLYETIRATAESDASVLIEGESGTGKELIATAFHLKSRRSSRPFVRINCAAIPAELIESELFGFKRSAFTGADHDKRGLIESADGGTLLLDEIVEMPVHIQAKLLRVLQERVVRRLGDERETAVDFRLIAATNCTASQAIMKGRLREDLYYRISTVRIKVPPLRERLEDIPPLADCFLKRYSSRYNRTASGLSEPTHRLLLRYEWPGNVRELQSVIEHAVLFCQDGQITPACLPEHLTAGEPANAKCLIAPHLTMEEIEREAICQTLERTGGNIKKAAQILSVHRPTFYRKLKKYGIRPDLIVTE